MIKENNTRETRFSTRLSKSRPNGQISPKDNGNLLREAFSNQTYYDEFCLLLNQLHRQSNGNTKYNSFTSKTSSNEFQYEQKIGLDGKIKRVGQEIPSSFDAIPAYMRVTIKLFEEAAKNKASLQQKREFLRKNICQEFVKSAKTILDFKKRPISKIDRYMKHFVQPKVQNGLSLASLQNQFSNKNKEFLSDYILDIKLLKTCFGHDDGQNEQQPGASIYNIAFDKSGKLLFSADQQGLIKVWSKQTGLLLFSFRGHTSYIEQIYIAEGNKYLISSGPQGIRIWSLIKFECVATYMFDNAVINANTYYSQNTGLLVFFSDSDYLYIIEQSTFINGNGKKVELDTIFRKIQIVKDPEQKVIQISINSNGYCLIGLDNGAVLLFDKTFLQNPLSFKFKRIQQHYKKNLELSWNKSGKSFISCNVDGSCKIWDFTLSCFDQSFSSIAQLRMHRHDRRRKRKQVICNSVAWSCNQNYILACFSEMNDPDVQQKVEGQILIWDYQKKQILHQVRSRLFYKLQAVTILEPHPTIQSIAMFCQSNGRIVLIDILKCQLLNVFHQRCFHLDMPHVVIEPIQAKFCPDGTLLAVSTQYGNISLYGCGSRNIYFHCPTDQFFRTDKEIFIPNEQMIPISASTDININLLDKYPMCNVVNISYDFQYKNDLIQLANKNFFSQQIVAVTLATNPYKSDPFWELVIEKQTQQNLSKQELLKHFYLTLELHGNQQLNHQQNFIIGRYRQVLDESLNEFNQVSTTLEQPVIKTVDTRRLRKNKIKQSDFGSQDKAQSERQSFSYHQQQSPSQISYESQSPLQYHNLRRRGRRPILHLDSDRDDSIVENAKKPPAQRIQQLDEGFEELQQRRNRRGRKRIVESDQQLHAGAQNQLLPNQLCTRCQKSIMTAIEKCQICKNVYCTNCSNFRIIKQIYGSSCLNCVFLRKSTKQKQKAVNRSHFSDVVRSQECYIPQIDDEVYFFYQGYEQLLLKYFDCLNPEAAQIFQEFQLLAIDALEELKTAPLCRITDMQYLFPIKPKNKLGRRQQNLQQKIKQILIAVELITEKGLTFQIFYIPEFIEFLVRKQIIGYVQSNLKDLIKKIQQNNFETTQHDEEVMIVKVKPLITRDPINFWRTIEVTHNEQGTRRLRKDLSKTFINIWEIKSKMPIIPYKSMQEEQSNQILHKIDALRIVNPSLFQLFNVNVRLEDYPHYLDNVKVPMCIQTILQRLRNNYYTSLKSIIFDLNLIPSASTSFSGPQHQVTIAAYQLIAQVTAIIDNNQDSGNLVNNMQQQPQLQHVIEDQKLNIQQIHVKHNPPVQKQILQPFHKEQSIQQEYSNPRNKRRGRQTRRNTRANPQPQPQRRTRNARVNYREMQADYRSQQSSQQILISTLPRRQTRQTRYSMRQ